MTKILSLSLLVMLSGCAAHPTSMSDPHALHSQKSNPMGLQPQEQGQSAFAAIAEIVSILSADPDTDWSQVSIDALREHLLDMQQVTMQTVVSREQIGMGVYRFDVAGEGRVIAAIQRMVPAHAAVVSKSLNWQITTEKSDTGVVLQLSADDELEQQKIAALGFYGFMAIGAHHQMHHLAMARGRAVHQH